MDREEMTGFVEGKVKEVIEASNRELLGDISKMISKISDKSSSNISALDFPKFKRRSNEEQLKLNSKVIDRLDGAHSAIDLEDLPSAKEAILQARDILKRRQKLVLLADTSDLGWRVVNEYESNPIASDSDDEKRIYKAEVRASRKAKAEKGRKPKRFLPYKRPEVPGSSQTSQGPRQRPGLCFLCGKAGHWKNECTQNNTYQNNKLSSCLNISVKVTELSQVAACKERDQVGMEANFDKCNGEKISETGKENPISPVGRLKENKEKWYKLSDNQYILDVVENGYRLPFKNIPENAHLKNNRSALENKQFVKGEINSLLQKRVISEVSEKPHVVNPLTVAYNKAGKPRLVLDCRHINPCLHMFKIKFEDINTAENLFDLGTFVYSFDLKSAYHHIDIFSEHSTYLGFSWFDNGVEKYYVYNSLPFGISSAGHIFTKTLRVLIKYWRSLGHRVIMFLDDGIGGHNSFKNAVSSSNFIRSSLIDLGFLLAEEKCSWNPSQIACWLGHTLNYCINRLFISEDRISRLEMALKSVLFQLSRDNCNLIHVKCLASVVGQIISLQSVLGKIVCRKTRYMYKCIIGRASWNAPIKVSENAQTEIQFWLDNARNLNKNGKQMKQLFSATLSMVTDASAVGYGGYVAKNEKSYAEYSPTDSDEETFLGWSLAQVHGNVLQYENRLPEVNHEETSLSKSTGNGFPPTSETVKKSAPGCEQYVKVLAPGCEQNVKGLAPGCEQHVKVLAPGCEQNVNGLAPGSEQTVLIKEHGFVKKTTPGSESDDLVLPVISTWFNKNVYYSRTEVHGSWTGSEKGKSSTWRELEALYRVLRSNVKLLQNNNVIFFTDNKNLKFILNSGSFVDDLHEICLRVHEVCEESNIKFIVIWVPRRQNTDADYLSRCLDCDDWSVNDVIFIYLDEKWGTFTVDRFATHYNNKCSRFNSRWWVPGTEAVDCFTQNWTGENNWLVPPPNLVIQCLNKLINEKCRATLVIPEWKSAPFWPLLIDENGYFNNIVKDCYVFPYTGAVTKGKGNNGVFNKEPFSFRMLALKCNGLDI